MADPLLVTFNAGSSTVKIGLFTVDGQRASRVGKGMIDFRKAPLRFELSEGPDRFDIDIQAEIRDFYSLFYQVDISDPQLTSLLGF